MLNETYTLNNGIQISKLALGTWLIGDDAVADAVKSAIEIGYRHIDTAQAYDNERGVGEGVRTSGTSREELFVVSLKLPQNTRITNPLQRASTKRSQPWD